MTTLQIELDGDTNASLATLAAARGISPADLAAVIVSEYVARPAPDAEGGLRYATLDEARALLASGKTFTGPDPLDALVGKYEGDPVNDIDAVVYDR